MGVRNDAWDDQRRRTRSNRPSFLIPSPGEDKRTSDASNSTREGAVAGFKAAAITCVITAVPTLFICRAVPWAKANLNYTAQALIISGSSIAAYFITADKTLLKNARRNANYDKST